MRAYFYYELASMYNRVPLITTSQTSDVPQASPAEIWGQILLDLKTAADIMPAWRGGTSSLEAPPRPC